MYRRIEMIYHSKRKPTEDDHQRDYKQGLCGIYPEGGDKVCDAWAGMNVPRKRISKNCRFYFTERGWELYGRKTVEELQKAHIEYRVIAVEEHARNIDVYYKDSVQVALRPRRKMEANR